MKDRLEVILSGVGGQGLILSGTILGDAAITYENKSAALTSSYGVETRGTFTKSDLIISDRDIYYPEVIKPDIILAMAQIAYNRYASTLKEDTILVYDNTLVTEVIETKAKQYGFPITSMAREIGNVTVANIIACGIIVRMMNFILPESVIHTLEKSFSHRPKILKSNIIAFNKGFNRV